MIRHPYAYHTSLKRQRKVGLTAMEGPAFGHGFIPNMRLDHAEREWETARRTVTSVNTALREAGHKEFPTDHLDNQLAVLRQPSH